MQDLAFTNRMDLISFERDKTNGGPTAVGKLNLESTPVLVHVNHRANIPAVQLRVVRVSIQDNQVKFFDHADLIG